MSQCEVSVIMSVHNGERFLAEAVESVLAQTFPDFEFIVIDDGSTDGTTTLLGECQKRDARVRVYHQDNKGLIESLNRGCSLARGRYIARMDADDVAVKDRLMWQIEFMERHPEVGVVGGAVQFINALGEPGNRCLLPTSNREIQSALLSNCVLVHPTVLMRKDAFVSVGGYRKIMVDAEDYDLWLRIADHFQLANLPAVVLKYRHHPDQVSVRKRNQQALSCLVAQAATLVRRTGKPDPLDSLKQITPAVLARLGVSEAMQQANRCRHYLGRIRSMYDAGEYASALSLVTEILRSPDLKEAEKWVVADLYLFAARLHGRQSKPWKTICAAAYAVITRPTILVRPSKLSLRWVRRVSARIPKEISLPSKACKSAEL